MYLFLIDLQDGDYNPFFGTKSGYNLRFDKGPSLCSGFRLRAKTLAMRFKFESFGTKPIDSLKINTFPTAA
jgi:hypothetical protein